MIAYRVFMKKLEGKRQLGSHRLRWEGNNKMYFRERGWGGMDWIDLAPDSDQWRALVNTVMNIWVPSNVGTFLSN
jgi:hypothetical protein